MYIYEKSFPIFQKLFCALAVPQQSSTPDYATVIQFYLYEQLVKQMITLKAMCHFCRITANSKGYDEF